MTRHVSVGGNEPAAPERDQDALRERALSAMERGEADEALGLSEDLIGRFPDVARSHFIRARVLATFGRPEEALDTLRSSLSLHKGDFRALAMMRTLAAGLGCRDEAVDYARKASEVAPHERKNLLFLLGEHIRSNDHKAALRVSETLIQHHDSEPQAWLLRAEVMAAAGRAKDALRALRAGVERHPTNYALLKAARNAALERERPDEALNYATQMLALHPMDRKNLAAIIQLHMRRGEFETALIHADAMVTHEPYESDGIVLRAQSLAAMNRVTPALNSLRDAVMRAPHDNRLLIAARNLAFQHGRFEAARDYGMSLRATGHQDKKSLEYIAQSLMALGDVPAVEAFIASVRATPSEPRLKTEHHLQSLHELSQSTPIIVDAWRAAVTDDIGPKRSAEDAVRPSPLGATMIQYWSQGTPPDDVQLVLTAWRDLFEREELGRVELYDRKSAAVWIQANAPEFTPLFDASFHYAMESDIFRIAYASKRPCIYVDIDGWPLEQSAEIMRFGVRSGSSLLYFRSYRPWIVNGFFIGQPACPFFRLLVEQALSVDLSTMPKDHHTIENSFGPTRYNKVLSDLLGRDSIAGVGPVVSVRGCSELRLGGNRILFSHEAAAASVRPPFRLGYKTTGDYWKGLAI
jgi:tetratricopeptide (TPR) repeat protein